MTDIEVNKPEPIAIDRKLKSYNTKSEVRPAIVALIQGKSILIDEYYNDGISLLKDLHKHLKRKLPNTTFKEQQEYRSEYQRLSNLVFIRNRRSKTMCKEVSSYWLASQILSRE